MSHGSHVTHSTSHSAVDESPTGPKRSFMKRGLSILAAAGLALSGTALGATAAHAVDLDFPDEALQAGINNAIDPNRAADATITSDDIQPIHQLRLDETYSVASLEGMQAFNDKTGANPKLSTFQAFGTFSDLTPLTELENLGILYVHSPNVTALPQLAHTLNYVDVGGTSIVMSGDIGDSFESRHR